MTYRAMESQMLEQCRVCMSSWATATNTNWLNLFTDGNSIQMLYTIEQVTGREVKQDENLPEMICPPCLTAAKTALKFKQRLERSLQLLKQSRTRNEETINSISEVSVKNEFESQTEERRFGCPHCSKTFTKSSGLEAHLRIHTGDQPFECSQCSKTFTQSSNLKRHLRTHTGERPFQCSHCSRAFGQSSSLSYHLGTHTGERRFKCSNCPKDFDNISSLKRHLRTHTAARPFECSQCLKSFIKRCHLMDHLRTHTGEQPFECTHCLRTFTHRNRLKHHLLTHIEDSNL